MLYAEEEIGFGNTEMRFIINAMDRFNIVFNKITVNDDGLDSKIFFSKLISISYSDNDGMGFTDVDMVDSLVSATFLKSITAFYRIWNAETGEMEKQSYELVKEIRFYVDFEKHCLAVEGNIADMNKLKGAFRNYFWKSFTYDSLSLSPYNYLEIFQNDHYLYSIDEITITDFPYSNILLGKYVAKIVNPTTDVDDISEYKYNIVKVKTRLNFENETIAFSASSNNLLNLACSDKVKYLFFKYLTSKLY